MKLFKDSVYSVLVMMLFAATLMIVGEIDNDMLLVGVFFTAIITGTLAIIFIIIWGLPIHFFFKKLKVESVYFYSLMGITPGIILFSVDTPFHRDPVWVFPLYAGFVGATGSLTFWYLHVRENT